MVSDYIDELRLTSTYTVVYLRKVRTQSPSNLLHLRAAQQFTERLVYPFAVASKSHT